MNEPVSNLPVVAEPVVELEIVEAEIVEEAFIPEGWYRCIAETHATKYGSSSDTKRPVLVGDVIFTSGRKAQPENTYDYIGVIFGGSMDGEGRSFVYPKIRVDTFYTHFEPCTEEALDHRMEEVSEDLNVIRQSALDSQHELDNYRPHILPGVGSDSSAIVRGEAVDVVDAKKGLKTRANEVAKISERMKGKADTLATTIKTKSEVLRWRMEQELALKQEALNAQLAVFNRQMESMKSQLALAEEALWTINLYLGGEEIIELWREGEAAPAIMPIKIQQLVLYMDEECALEAEDGGIDVNDLSLFKQWVLSDPKHLTQLCPFQKGMVALTVRRRDKQYDVDMSSVSTAYLTMKANAEKNEANMTWTYFLIRNGENVYWVTTNFTARGLLIPRRDEFLSYFRDSEGEMIDVGDDRYMKAMEQAQAQQKHYMRIALIFQGLIDRTTIFHPMEKRPNILLEGTYGEGVEIVYDGESMLEGTLLPFKDYLKQVNSTIDVGCRIVGTWHASSGLKQFTEETGDSYNRKRVNSRISHQKAGFPSDDLIYTIDGVSRNGYYKFLYPRPGERWQNGPWVPMPDKPGYVNRPHSGYVPYKTNVSCLISRDDEFVLNIDGCRAEDLRNYLHNRTSRQDYVSMFPLIRTALKVKAQEEIEEAPFMRLITGQLINQGLDPDAAEAEAQDLARWYKTKNKRFRTLLEDDAAAYAAIMEQYAFRLKQRPSRAALDKIGPAIVAEILAQFPDTILIGHQKDNLFRALRKADSGPIWVHEQTWRRSRDGSLVLADTNEWTVMDRRPLQWTILFRDDEAVATLEVSPNRLEHLTGPEAEELWHDAYERFCRYVQDDENYYARRQKREPETIKYSYLAARRTKHGLMQMLLYKQAHRIPEGKYLTGEWVSPKLNETTVRWTKTPSELQPEPFRISETREGSGWHKNMERDRWWTVRAPEGDPNASFRDQGGPAAELLYFDADAVAAYDADVVAYEAAQLVRQGMAEKVDRSLKAIVKAKEARLLQDLYHKFLADFGDAELWEGHRKQHAAKLVFELKSEDLKQALRRLVESGVNVDGMTVQEVLASYEGAPEPEIEWVDRGGGSRSGTHTGRTIFVKQNDCPADILDIKIDWAVLNG